MIRVRVEFKHFTLGRSAHPHFTSGRQCTVLQQEIQNRNTQCSSNYYFLKITFVYRNRQQCYKRSQMTNEYIFLCHWVESINVTTYTSCNELPVNCFPDITGRSNADHLQSGKSNKHGLPTVIIIPIHATYCDCVHNQNYCRNQSYNYKLVNRISPWEWRWAWPEVERIFNGKV